MDDDGSGGDEAEQGKTKRLKRAMVAAFVDKAKARKAVKDFPGESFEERMGKLFCVYCNDHVPFDFKTAVRQHLQGRRSKDLQPFAQRTEAGKLRIRHHKKKVEHAATQEDKGERVRKIASRQCGRATRQSGTRAHNGEAHMCLPKHKRTALRCWRRCGTWVYPSTPYATRAFVNSSSSLI